MKNYYMFGESTNKVYFPIYYKKFKFTVRNRGDIDVSYYSFCYKQNMIDIIGKKIRSKNWVKERVTRMGNEEAIKLCNAYPNCIVVVENRSKRIIELIKIKTLRL